MASFCLQGCTVNTSRDVKCAQEIIGKHLQSIMRSTTIPEIPNLRFKELLGLKMEKGYTEVHSFF